MASATTKSCVAIINPAGAGGRARRSWLKASPTVKRKLQQHNLELVERFTTAPGHAVQLAAEAVASGAAAVLAVGGDGMIHEVVSGMMTHYQHQQQPQQDWQSAQAVSTALSILPVGTGSDFRRTFGWVENDAAAACERIIGGKCQPLDIGQVTFKRYKHTNSSGRSKAPEQSAPVELKDEQQQAQQQLGGVASSAELQGAEVKFFVNVMSCGVAGLVNEIICKFKVLRALSYPVASAAALLYYKRCAVEVCCDEGGWQLLDDLTMLVVGNGCYWGGGMHVLPHASTSDGLFEVLAVQTMGLMDFITKGHLLRSGKYTDASISGVTVLPRCKTIAVRQSSTSKTTACTDTEASTAAAAADAAVAPKWEVDGEAQGAWREAQITLLPGALQLCV